jgi:MoxR-like ATPase
MDALEKFKQDISLIAERYFIDPSTAHGIDHYKLTLLGLGYVLRQNTLLMGEPGFGKTSGAKVVEAVLSSLPYDLYEACQLEGHPEQTHEILVGRADMHKLITKGEQTIWNLAVYLPTILADEVNRLPEGKQDGLLTCIDTGRFNSALGHTLHTGKRPFYATANYKDEGNTELIPALRDRFAVSIELGHTGTFHREAIRAASGRRGEISSPDLTTEIMHALRDTGTSDEGKLGKVREYQQRFAKHIKGKGLQPLDADDLESLARKLAAPGLAQDALIFLDMLEAEMNYTPLYGLKRRSDPPDTSTHAQKLASTKCLNALSPRATLAIESYAKAIAALQGREKAAKEDIMAVAPYVLAHRIEPTEDFRAAYADKTRQTRGSEQHELAARLLDGVEANYKAVHKDLAILDNHHRGTLTGEDNRKRARQLLATDPDKIDHPLLKEYILGLKERR